MQRAIFVSTLIATLWVGTIPTTADNLERLCSHPEERTHSLSIINFSTVSKDLTSTPEQGPGARFVCVKNHSNLPIRVFWPLVMNGPNWVDANARIGFYPGDPLFHLPQLAQVPTLRDTCFMYNAVGEAILTPLHVLPTEISAANQRPIDARLSWCSRLYDAALSSDRAGRADVLPPVHRRDLPSRKVVHPFQLFFPLDDNRPSETMMRFSGTVTTALLRSDRDALSETSFSYAIERKVERGWSSDFSNEWLARFTFSAVADFGRGHVTLMESNSQTRWPKPNQRGTILFSLPIGLDDVVTAYRANLVLRNGESPVINVPFYMFQRTAQ